MTQPTILCEYQQGEARGVGLLKQLKTFAPDEETAAKIAVQIEDEQKHDRLFATRLKELDVDCNSMMDSLIELYDLAQDCVDREDWVQSIAMQAVIEELAMSTFSAQLPKQDKKTQAILKEIIQDEERHLAFTMEELGKMPEGSERRIADLHKAVGKIFVSAIKDTTRPAAERAQLRGTMTRAYTLHKARLKQLGIRLPGIKELAKT